MAFGRSAKKVIPLKNNLAFWAGGLALAVTLAIVAGVASYLGALGGEEKIGSVHCTAAKAFSMSVRVPSKRHPSRHLYFEPTSHDGYSEAIYEASVSAKLTNSGPGSFVITDWANPKAEQTVVPGSSITLRPRAFKQYHIIVATLGEEASIDFEFSLDQSVTVDGTWRLMAAWADGP